MSIAYYNYVMDIYQKREERKIERARIRDISNPFDLPEPEFLHLWRINKSMAHYLVEQLRADLEPRNSEGLPVHVKVLCAVQFLANGGYQRQIGQDHSMCHAQSTASKYIEQFTDAIYSRLLAEWVHFPASEAARSTISSEFEDKFGVPGVLGLIDCTHVKIFPPAGPQGAQYKNVRKEAHTINVQLIVDANCKILSVNARYPGRVHDAFVWRHCAVKEEMKRLFYSQIGSYFLLGDSGYPLEPWLMTPILNAGPDTPEGKYTTWHCQARNAVERTNGYLKGSLRCMGIDRTLHYAPEKCSKIIYACCIIYNLMKFFRVPLEEVEENRADDIQPMEDNLLTPAALLRTAQNKRDLLVRNYF